MTPHTLTEHGAPPRASAHHGELKQGASTLPLQAQPGLNCLEALGHASDLLKCASATAYESADPLRGAPRDMAMAVVHMLEMARTLLSSAMATEEDRLRNAGGK